LSPVFQERCAALCELTSMKQAESRRKSYEWVVSVSPVSVSGANHSSRGWKTSIGRPNP
jgi:hypothetical protein